MLLILLVIAFVTQATADKCLTPNNETAECILLDNCPILLNALKDPNSYAFIHLSYCGSRLDDNLICCGTASDFIETENTFSDEKVCGLQHSDDYEHSEDPVLTQFPWVALIGYQRKNGKDLPFEKRYKCSGSLISKRYVLTTAECLIGLRAIPISVRLGEFHIINKTDCIQDHKVYECADDAEDFQIEDIIPHPGYDKKTKVNNIGLIQLARTPMYTDYIRPICLPTSNKVKAKPGDKLVMAGWGPNYINSTTKQITYATLAISKLCKNSLGDSAAINSNNIMCGTATNNCRYVNQGDAVMFSHKSRWHQEGVVSDIKSCENKLPLVFTKVEHYLDWIKEVISS